MRKTFPFTKIKARKGDLMAQGDILKILEKKQQATVREISQLTNTNIYSIYKNLKRLQKQGIVVYKRGIVRLVQKQIK